MTVSVDYTTPEWEDWQAQRLAHLAATLIPADDHTRKVNDRARDVPDWMQVRAELRRNGEDW